MSGIARRSPRVSWIHCRRSKCIPFRIGNRAMVKRKASISLDEWLQTGRGTVEGRGRGSAATLERRHQANCLTAEVIRGYRPNKGPRVQLEWLATVVKRTAGSGFCSNKPSMNGSSWVCGTTVPGTKLQTM